MADYLAIEPAAGGGHHYCGADSRRRRRARCERWSILLRREGCDVTAADNGTAAIDLLQQHFFDMLISTSKCRTSGGTCWKAGDQPRSSASVTAYGSKVDSGAAARAADYIDKPFNVEELKFRSARSCGSGLSRRTSG
jgi:CheY-like chemotaxis protein